MREAIIGTVSGISAVVAVSLLTPRPAPVAVPVVREVRASDGGAAAASPGARYAAATRPDPARAKLEKELDRVYVYRARLDKMIAFIADSTGANVWVNWRALEAAGINPDAPITLNLKHLPARVMLRMILEEAGGNNIKLMFRAEEGIVRVSTAEDLYREVSTRVYDIRDLIEEGVKNGAQEGDAMDALVRLIQETIDPTVWRDAGGSVGGIRALNGRLIVTQTVENHEELANLLAMLRSGGTK